MIAALTQPLTSFSLSWPTPSRPSFLHKLILRIQLPKPSWRNLHSHLWRWKGQSSQKIWESERGLLSESFQAYIKEGARWPKKLQREFRQFFPDLDMTQFHELVADAFATLGKEDRHIFSAQWTTFFSKERLEKWLSLIDPEAKNGTALAKQLDRIFGKSETTHSSPRSTKKIQDFFSSLKEKSSFILNTLLRVLDLHESVQSSHTLWEKVYLFDLYFKIFLIPVALVNLLTPLGLLSWQIYLLVALILSARHYWPHRPAKNGIVPVRNSIGRM